METKKKKREKDSTGTPPILSPAFNRPGSGAPELLRWKDRSVRSLSLSLSLVHPPLLSLHLCVALSI